MSSTASYCTVWLPCSLPLCSTSMQRIPSQREAPKVDHNAWQPVTKSSTYMGVHAGSAEQSHMFMLHRQRDARKPQPQC